MPLQVNHIQSHILRSVAPFVTVYSYAQIPGNPLLFINSSGVDTVGLSAEHYESLTTDQQAFFFADPTTPNTWADFTTFYAAVSVQSWFNDENVMGTLDKGVAVYTSTTDRSTLNRGLRWFGLDPIYPEFGPTWNDADVWEDAALWTE